MKFYQSAAWRATAYAAKRRDCWLCVRCAKAGRTVAARVVHHRQAINDGGALLDPGNLESVCRSCHEEIHGRGPSEQEKDWNTFNADQRRKQF